jgi:hypothetical protein
LKPFLIRLTRERLDGTAVFGGRLREVGCASTIFFELAAFIRFSMSDFAVLELLFVDSSLAMSNLNN